MTRVLVTGGAGAVGANLSRRLLERGCDVVVLDDLSSGHPQLVDPQVRFIQGSVSDDEAIQEAFDHAPECVIHLAALFANQNSVEHPQRDLVVNGLGTLKVLENAQRGGSRKVVFASSSCVYGHKEIMREDDTDLRPDTPYAMTKLLGEHYAKFWAAQHGLDVCVVRLFNSYGPFEYPGRYRNVIPNFFQLAMSGEPLPITGTGEETRDFTYVGDIVRGIEGALFGDTEPGGVYNLGSGRETSINELAGLINEIAGNTAGVAYSPRRSWDHVTRRVADCSKARETFGYEPAMPLMKGLRETHDWLRAVDA